MVNIWVTNVAECKRLAKEAAVARKELEEAKSQLMVMEYNKEKDMEEQNKRAQEEIGTLQQLVQETVDESTLCQHEIRKLLDENDKLRQERQELKEELAQQVGYCFKLFWACWIVVLIALSIPGFAESGTGAEPGEEDHPQAGRGRLEQPRQSGRLDAEGKQICTYSQNFCFLLWCVFCVCGANRKIYKNE